MNMRPLGDAVEGFFLFKERVKREEISLQFFFCVRPKLRALRHSILEVFILTVPQQILFFDAVNFNCSFFGCGKRNEKGGEGHEKIRERHREGHSSRCGGSA